MAIPEQLLRVAQQVKEGGHPEFPVREILSWFGAKRRGGQKVLEIKEAFDEVGVTTDPDFEEVYIGAPVTFDRRDASQTAVIAPEGVMSAAGVGQVELNAVVRRGLAHRISRLKAAGREPVSVTPDSSLEKAVTIMMANDFSQLPVMQSPRELKGLISWKSIGKRLALHHPCAVVRDCMDGARELSEEASLFEAVEIIAAEDCVLIRRKDNTIRGPITAYDISFQYQELAKPFLLIGQIENQLRFLISMKFSKEDLAAAKDPADPGREISDPNDLTFGEYVRLLQADDGWAKLDIPLHRGEFVRLLDKIREVRNDVMHFNPDPMPMEDYNTLEKFARFLDELA